MTMTRMRLVLLSFLLLGLLAACGGDDEGGGEADEPGDGDTTAEAAADGNGEDGDGTETAEAGTPTPEPVMPTPTAFHEDDPIVSMAGAGTTWSPTAAEFEALPQSTISADGEEYSGVSLADAAAEMGATDAMFFLVEGTRSDGTRFAQVRFSLEEHGETSLLTPGEGNHLRFVGSAIEPAQWLTAVTAVSFD